MGPEANMTTRGACRVTADPDAERSVAHVFFSGARPQGGTPHNRLTDFSLQVNKLTK